MEKRFKNNQRFPIIILFLIAAALILFPRLTGRSFGELFNTSATEQTENIEGDSIAEVGEQPDTGENTSESTLESTDEETPAPSSIAEDGSYTSKEDVAEYIHIYGKLPQNFITKDEACALG